MKALTKNSIKGIAIFLSITACILFCRLFNGTVSVFNYSFYIISSGSMEPSYPVSTLIVLKKAPFNSLRVGDVIVFKSNALSGGTAFHRICRLDENGVYTKGDQNNFEDNQLITEREYVGKEIASNYSLGFFLYQIKTIKGFMLFLVLPFFIICLIFFSFKQFIRYRSL